ncbi:glycosyl transferase, group 1 family protein [Desulfurella amilsii]|uniref:Glycosyl transferase, group 1 family protein n=1 Tax=Desulfurella amilsii TaxID=1562698 RepID=A0A1X4XWK3_9BACT|nr:glycosyltransferase [Desulfurella amilsii]OSS41905.1 glycosyl transferase, group 1 family protein [Desulfurella amilsii]
MNVAIILDETWNSSLTFLGKVFLEILNKSCQVSLLCQQDSYIDKAVKTNKYYIKNLRTKNPINFFRNLNQIRNYFNDIKPQLVFTIRGDATFYACLLKKHNNFKLVRIFGESRKPKLNRHCVDYVFLSPKKFENFINIPHKVINGVVDTKKFTYKKEGALKIRKEFGIDDSAFVYGFIGRTSPVKGISLLLEAFSKLTRQAKLFMLVYETEIKINDLLQKIKQLNLQDCVIIESNYRDDVKDIISAFDVGVVSSIGSEAIARTSLEYLSAGKPCIVTDVGCLAEVVSQDCAIVCKPNVASLYQALNDIQSKNLTQMGQSALKNAQMYSMESLKFLIDEALNEIQNL